MDVQQIILPPANIIADPTLQPRVDGLDLSHVRELEATAETWPPLKVVRRSDGYLLVDGFHRLAAAQNLGLERVAVEVLDAPEDGDLAGLAFALNAVHGRPLTLGDRRAFAARLLRLHPDWSDREIGRRSGLVQPTVAKVRAELEANETIAPAETRTGRDGRSYPASTSSKGGHTLSEVFSKFSEVLERSITPAERIQQRDLVRYFEKVADLLEEQDNHKGFETIAAGAEACRAVLGDEKARLLGGRLGWASLNILEVAKALGYREEPA